MAEESGRNVDQPEYLNEKDAAEDREDVKPEDRTSGSNRAEQEKDQIIDSTISKTFQH